MDNLGPAAAVRIEPRRSGDQPSQERRQHKPHLPAVSAQPAGKDDKDRDDVAATEPEIHQLDERA